ncbi:MAG: hypothetical protein KAI95_18790 [Bacteroidales bacterium]|nr:hypothetical protein [Bacteroidales bacterium]
MKAKSFFVFNFSFFILTLAGIGLHQNNSLPRLMEYLHRAAMISYLVSLNFWAILIYIGSKTEVDPFMLFGTGILSMVVIFAFSWVIIKMRRYA